MQLKAGDYVSVTDSVGLTVHHTDVWEVSIKLTEGAVFKVAHVSADGKRLAFDVNLSDGTPLLTVWTEAINVEVTESESDAT